MPQPRLEVFDTSAAPGPGVVVTDDVTVEENRLAAWELGYRAGWDDATGSVNAETERITVELARNLQALGFTWQEARAHLLAAIEPVLLSIVTRILPELAHESLAPLVLDQLMLLVSDATTQPATLVLHPSARDRVEALITSATGLPLLIEEEPSLGEGQVYLRLGPREVKVDLTRASAEIATAVRDFFTLSQEPQNG